MNSGRLAAHSSDYLNEVNYMQRLVMGLLLIAATAILGIAQGADHNEKEFFVGYSNGQVDGSTGRFVHTTADFGDTGPLKFHGINVAGVYNFTRYVGVKADVSATFHGGDFSIPFTPTTTVNGNARNSLYNVLGGVQIKDNAVEGRVKPFAHILVGLGHARTRVESNCTGLNCLLITPTSTDTGLAGAFGGGLDVRVNDRFDVRVGQIDYNPVFLKGNDLHNVRLSIGIIIK